MGSGRSLILLPTLETSFFPLGLAFTLSYYILFCPCLAFEEETMGEGGGSAGRRGVGS